MTVAAIQVNNQTLTTLIASALRLVGSLASGEVPSPAELNDAGLIANQMLDAWSAERISVPAVSPITTDANNVALSLVANQQKYQLGLGAPDFNLARPARIDRISVLYSASQQTPVEVPLEMLTDVGWQNIANKNTPSLLPNAVFNDLGFPFYALYFWPVPTQANPITLYAWAMLTQFADFVTQYSFQPAYWEAIRYNLAVRLAAEFPCDLQKLPLVMQIARESKARIGAFNAPIKEASVDRALLQGRGRGNIYTGEPTRGSGS